jgi:hypothetical protein
MNPVNAKSRRKTFENRLPLPAFGILKIPQIKK